MLAPDGSIKRLERSAKILVSRSPLARIAISRSRSEAHSRLSAFNAHGMQVAAFDVEPLARVTSNEAGTRFVLYGEKLRREPWSTSVYMYDASGKLLYQDSSGALARECCTAVDGTGHLYVLASRKGSSRPLLTALAPPGDASLWSTSGVSGQLPDVLACSGDDSVVVLGTFPRDPRERGHLKFLSRLGDTIGEYLAPPGIYAKKVALSGDGSVCAMVGGNHLAAIQLKPEFEVLFEKDYVERQNYWYRSVCLLPGSSSILASLSDHLSERGGRLVQRYNLSGRIVSREEFPQELFLSDRGPDIVVGDNPSLYFVETASTVEILAVRPEDK